MDGTADSRIYDCADVPALDFDPFLRESLQHAPVSRIRVPHGQGDCWLVTRYHDVRFVTSDPRFSRDILGSAAPKMTKHTIPLERAVSYADPPEHARVRGVVAQAFGQRGIDRLRLRAQLLLEGLMTDLEAAGPPADLIEHVVSPFPLQLIGELLGVPAADRARWCAWTQTLFTRAHDEAAAARAAQIKQAARDYFGQLAARRRAEPRDDVMTVLVTAVDDGRIDEDELLALATLLQLNGWHAVRNNAANMMYALLTHDGLADRLRARPSLVPRAVEELLRWIPHKHAVGQPRVATEDVRVGDQVIRAGEFVYVSYVAANRDGEVYEDPDRIDFERQGPPHIAFGHGPHYCVAPQLARMEAELLLSNLLTRFPRMRLAVPAREVRWQTDVVIRGPVGLPVVW
ncbi:cytochrome P450 [Streptomyces gamaensis]|uniref:Cytochrome P450 n=1 Tax=Streptomyces gamaensis TaxID=1763542 RepID=A0ABW0YW80_9ACTN